MVCIFGTSLEISRSRRRSIHPEVTVMGHRCKMLSDDCSYRVMEVVMMKRSRDGKDLATTHTLLVDNNHETLKQVQENMDEIINNLIGVSKMARSSKKVDENAQLFEKSLDPLFSVMAETTQGHILDKLSISLRKALILMAMDRYQSNKETVCKALGISRDKLDREMAICGIGKSLKAA